MRNERPLSLVAVERDQMHQLTSSPKGELDCSSTNAATGPIVPATRHGRPRSGARPAGSIELPRSSSSRRHRRRDRQRSEVSERARRTRGVVDYALGVAIVNRHDHAQLDELRQLRHDVNYPADIVEPAPRELETIAALVECVVVAASRMLPTPKIPLP